MTDDELQAMEKEGAIIHTLQTGTAEEAADLLARIAASDGVHRAEELKRNYRPDGIPPGLLKCRSCGWWHMSHDTCGGESADAY